MVDLKFKEEVNNYNNEINKVGMEASVYTNLVWRLLYEVNLILMRGA